MQSARTVVGRLTHPTFLEYGLAVWYIAGTGGW